MKKHLKKAKYVIEKETQIDTKEHFLTFLGSFIGIALIGYLNSISFSISDNLFLIGSFGASSVLIYGVVDSPLAQPRNLIGGHLIGAVIGVTIHLALPQHVWFTSALSVACTIVVMQVTKCVHPPGGATALLPNIGSAHIQRLGYLYVISPVLTGVIILLAVALIINNITSHRKYPRNKHWYRIWARYRT